MADQFEPSIYDRHPNQIRLFLRDEDPTVLRWEIRANNNLTSAMAGTTALIETLQSKRTLISQELARSGKGVVGPTAFPKGATVFHFDPDEYGPATHASLPNDDRAMYMRVAPIRATGTGGLGPTVIIPPASFYSNAFPVWTEFATTTVVAATPGSPPPLNCPVFRVPSGTHSLKIRNEAKAGSLDLYVSFGWGQPMILIPAAEDLTISTGGISHVFVTSDTSSIGFSATFTIANYR